MLSLTDTLLAALVVIEAVAVWQRRRSMSNGQEQVDAILQLLDAATDRIAAGVTAAAEAIGAAITRVQVILEELAGVRGGLSQEAVAAVVEKLQGEVNQASEAAAALETLAAQAANIAKDPENPAPDEPEPGAEEPTEPTEGGDEPPPQE